MKVVFRPDLPALDLTRLICGIFISFAATTVIIKNQKHEKSRFVYLIMGMAVVLGLVYVGLAFSEAF